jgi:hypothetical protein
MRRDGLPIAGVAVLFGLAALYCFFGYAMNAALSVAGDYHAHRLAAESWGVAGVSSVVIAGWCTRSAWQKRKGDRQR